MLFCTSLIALVGAADQPQSSPRKLQIVNTKRQSTICELLFPSSILAVKMNRKTLVVVLEVEIYIYDISNMRLLHVIDTTKNPDAICALSPSSDPSYLAYPSPVPSPTSPLSTAAQTRSGQASQAAAAASAASLSGDVLLFDTRTLTVINVIQAHKSPIAHIAINSTGTLLATASDKGTVIRVFSIPSADKVYQFRRGTREAKIHSVSFNAVSTLLAVSSATETVHIFRLNGANQKQRGGESPSAAGVRSPSSPAGSIDSQDGRGQGGLEGGYEAFIDGKKKGSSITSFRRRSLGLTRGIAGSVGGYLPNTLTEMWEPSRDFAFLKLPTSGTRCIVALSSNMPHVMVVSAEGYFYCYNIDLENGGECSLMKQYSLLDSETDAAD